MNFELLRQAPLAVQIHLATVVPAFAIGTWQIFGSTKGSRAHRALGSGYLYCVRNCAALILRGRAAPVSKDGSTF